MSQSPKPSTPQNSTRERSHSSVPEPVPDWTEAREDWGWAWPLHHYGLGLVFLVVGIYGMFLVMKFWRSREEKCRNYFMCIALLISMFGLSRATVLILDPYTSHELVTFPPSLGIVMFSIGYPCLTSGFFLINWSLVEVTKLQLLPTRVHQRKVLVLVLSIHFLVVISFDSSFAFFPSMHLLLFICRSFFVFWGILLFGGFIFGGLRIQRQLKRNTLVFDGVSYRSRADHAKRSGDISSEHLAGDQINTTMVVTLTTQMGGVSHRKRHHARTWKVMKVAQRAAATGLLICFTQIYALWEFYVFYNNDVQPKAWPWWIYQTCFRVIELFMVSQMIIIVRRSK